VRDLVVDHNPLLAKVATARSRAASFGSRGLAQAHEFFF